MFNLFKKKPAALHFKQVKLFGKLPGFADFVRYKSADPEAVRWDAWVTDGVSSLMIPGEGGFRDTYWSLNICREINHAYHLTSLLSSQDKSGRHYPLVIMAEVQNDWLKNYKPSFPLLFEVIEEFGRILQLELIDNQADLINSIHDFEKKSWPLSKTELLDARIKALKKLRQDQTWGYWASEYPNLDLCAWKVSQIQGLSRGKAWKFPLGSDHAAQESSYWLQLIDDVRALKDYSLNYYSLYSDSVKNLVVELGNPVLPTFKSLFEPYAPAQIIQPVNGPWVFQGELDLMASANYWKQVSA